MKCSQKYLKVHIQIIAMQITDETFLSEYDICVLEEGEHIKDFSCGDQDLDYFIQEESSDYTKAKISVTHIVINKTSNKVIAYFSLANDKLSVNDFNSNSEFNRFRKRRFSHAKQIKSYPSVKLCRLAIDSSAKGRGIGTFILKIIFGMYAKNTYAGCRFVTVDAYNTAAPFYEKNGFQLLTKKENTGNTVPLYYDLTAI